MSRWLKYVCLVMKNTFLVVVFNNLNHPKKYNPFCKLQLLFIKNLLSSVNPKPRPDTYSNLIYTIKTISRRQNSV